MGERYEEIPIAVGVSVGQWRYAGRGSKAFSEESAEKGLHTYGETMAPVGSGWRRWRVDMDYFLTLKAILYI